MQKNVVRFGVLSGADQLVCEAVGEVLVRGVLAQVLQGQNRNRNGGLFVTKVPPSQRGHKPKPSRGVFPLNTGLVNPTKYRRVAALWQLDQQRIAGAFAGVILHQPRSQPSGLSPHDRVLLGIVIRLTAENFDGYERFL